MAFFNQSVCCFLLTIVNSNNSVRKGNHLKDQFSVNRLIISALISCFCLQSSETVHIITISFECLGINL